MKTNRNDWFGMLLNHFLLIHVSWIQPPITTNFILNPIKKSNYNYLKFAISEQKSIFSKESTNLTPKKISNSKTTITLNLKKHITNIDDPSQMFNIWHSLGDFSILTCQVDIARQIRCSGASNVTQKKGVIPRKQIEVMKNLWRNNFFEIIRPQSHKRITFSHWFRRRVVLESFFSTCVRRIILFT